MNIKLKSKNEGWLLIVVLIHLFTLKKETKMKFLNIKKIENSKFKTLIINDVYKESLTEYEYLSKIEGSTQYLKITINLISNEYETIEGKIFTFTLKNFQKKIPKIP